MWKEIFDGYDSDHDGKIPYKKFEKLLFDIARNEYVPNRIMRQIRKKSNFQERGYLEYLEYIAMIERKDMDGIFDDSSDLHRYKVIPKLEPLAISLLSVDPEDEQECIHYSPAIVMIILSVMEIVIFIFDASLKTQNTISQWLIYNPSRKVEFWRFLSYMLVHVRSLQLIFNIIIQLMIGIPLEMVHKWHRVFIIYFAGVLAGSFSASIADSDTCLAGASGGVYALITAHVATVLLNRRKMKVNYFQSCILSLLIVIDIGYSLYNRYGLEKNNQISYVAHIAGATTGIFIGIDILHNFMLEPRIELASTIGVLIYTVFLMFVLIYNTYNSFMNNYVFL